MFHVFSEHLLKIVHHRTQIHAINAWQQQYKLLTAISEQLIGTAGIALQQGHQLGEHIVAHAVAIFVIDLLEVIKVQQHQSVGQAGTLGIGSGHIQLFIHGTAVLYAGQRVNGGQLLQAPALAVVAMSKDISAGTDHNGGRRKRPHLLLATECQPHHHHRQDSGQVDTHGDSRTNQEERSDQAGVQPEQPRITHDAAHYHSTVG